MSKIVEYKVGDRVKSKAGKGFWHSGFEGTVRENNDTDLLVEFDSSAPDKGHTYNRRGWSFYAEDYTPSASASIRLLSKVAAPKAKKTSKGTQEYKGNGKHDWESVTNSGGLFWTKRLRVPGGWLYQVGQASPAFIPFPEKVAETAGYVL